MEFRSQFPVIWSIHNNWIKGNQEKLLRATQWRHWMLDHPEVEGDPQFRLKIVSSFSDPLKRQLAEAIRTEHRGADILNSKS